MISWLFVFFLRKCEGAIHSSNLYKASNLWNTFLLDLTVDILKGGGVNRLFIGLVLSC